MEYNNNYNNWQLHATDKEAYYLCKVYYSCTRWLPSSYCTCVQFINTPINNNNSKTNNKEWKTKFGCPTVSWELKILGFFYYADHDSEWIIRRKALLPKNLKPKVHVAPKMSYTIFSWYFR